MNIPKALDNISTAEDLAEINKAAARYVELVINYAFSVSVKTLNEEFKKVTTNSNGKLVTSPGDYLSPGIPRLVVDESLIK